jgi:cysteine-rich repeat protein
MRSRRRTHLASILLGSLVALLLALPSSAGVFIGATEAKPDQVTHPSGYTGSGGTLIVDVCIDPASPNAAAMAISVQNVVATFNARRVLAGNLWYGTSNNIPSGSVDFESVALHEVGHCLGLAHSNLASESGLSGNDANFAKSGDGADNTYDLGYGADALLSTGDDLRDDDTSFHYFDMSTNDPFHLTASVVDSTTYSRNLANLPGSDTFAASGDRSNNAPYSVFGTEAVMNQGSFFNEEQRLLTSDDVSAIRYAMSGVDETDGTSDDYGLQLNYIGTASSCDMKIDFDDGQTGFAVCSVSWTRIGNPLSTHDRITSANVYFNTGFSWYFNDETCGNGTLEGTEQCDDGDVIADDGCNQTCEIVTDWQCSGTPSVCAPICGNSLVQTPEACDDGGTTPGDGCDAVCQAETGYQCSGTPSLCTPFCGDGVIVGVETCDDNAVTPGDGCSATCQTEGGWLCSGAPSSCGEVCGDGLIVGSEACDDGGTTPGDGCDASCAVEGAWQCSGEPSSCDGICGDGWIRGAETCDDSGTTPGDGCDAVCQVELTWTCTGEPSVCSPPRVPAVSAGLRVVAAAGMVALGAVAFAVRGRRRSA